MSFIRYQQQQGYAPKPNIEDISRKVLERQRLNFYISDVFAEYNEKTKMLKPSRIFDVFDYSSTTFDLETGFLELQISRLRWS